MEGYSRTFHRAYKVASTQYTCMKKKSFILPDKDLNHVDGEDKLQRFERELEIMSKQIEADIKKVKSDLSNIDIVLPADLPLGYQFKVAFVKLNGRKTEFKILNPEDIPLEVKGQAVDYGSTAIMVRLKTIDSCLYVSE